MTYTDYNIIISSLCFIFAVGFIFQCINQNKKEVIDADGNNEYMQYIISKHVLPDYKCKDIKYKNNEGKNAFMLWIQYCVDTILPLHLIYEGYEKELTYDGSNPALLWILYRNCLPPKQLEYDGWKFIQNKYGQCPFYIIAANNWEYDSDGHKMDENNIDRMFDIGLPMLQQNNQLLNNFLVQLIE